jgi:phenylacetate-coenzyme A ligase PaaK-like adenylate-forming protein
MPVVAYDCGYGSVHVNADWVILEPVDAAYQPVAVGQPSQKVLLTNLANRVQPIIRYEMGDSVTIDPEPCVRKPAASLFVSKVVAMRFFVLPGREGNGFDHPHGALVGH